MQILTQQKKVKVPVIDKKKKKLLKGGITLYSKNNTP